MEDNVKKELKTLRKMVLSWKENYLGWVSPEGGNEYLIKEYSEEISMYVSPFIRRLYMCKHLNQTEVDEFLEFCSSQVEELRNTISDRSELQ